MLGRQRVANAFNKELVRSIRQSAGRFAAIAIISLLGAGFYAGLRMSSPDMSLQGDEFFDGGNLYDLSVMTELGLDDDILDQLREIEGVGAVMPAYQADAMVLAGDGNFAARIESLPVAAAKASDTSDGVNAISDDGEYINRPILIEGDWPESGECVVGVDAARENGLSIGDTITLEKGTSDLDDTFAKTRFVISGFVNSAAYAGRDQLGATSLGTGLVEMYLYVCEDAFKGDLPYTVAYITIPTAYAECWNTAAYDEAVAQVKARVDGQADTMAKARWDTVHGDAQAELDEARAEYEEEREKAEAELADAEAQLADAAAQLADAEAQLASSADELAAAKVELDGAKEELDATPAQLEAFRAELDANKAKLDETQAQLDAMKQLIDAGMADEQLKAQYEAALAAYNEGMAQYEQAEALYGESVAQYEDGLARYESGMAQYEDGMAQYWQGLAEYEQGIADYQQGLAEYQEGRAEADEKFADAEEELADAQADVDGIEVPEVYVVDRSKNYGAASLSSDAEGISQIALFLPFMFVLVAALVSLTSMTRMVEEERMSIGTHKALGYSRARITSKYLIYGVLAAGVGSVVGVMVFGKLLPWFIMASYQVIHATPNIPLPIHADVAVRAIGLSIGVTLIATWAAAAASLRSNPAALMLPRVPKAGKRILLEYITPLWSRMSFFQKVTARNLLRYKRRFFMAVAGIAGCMALLVVGFGLRDAIGSIVAIQYEDLIGYDATVQLDEDATSEQRQQVAAALDADDVDRWLAVDDFNMIATGSDDDMRIEVVVPEDAGELLDYVTLRDRESGGQIALADDSIVLTEKAATKLGLSVGDAITLYDKNDVGDKTGDGRTFTVGGITENYLGHYVYMTRSGYEASFGKEPLFDLLLVKLNDGADENAFSDTMLEKGGVNTVSFMAERMKTYEEMLDIMNKLIIVVVLLAAALAFVVLYNLTNINIDERVREIATLKVLGFTRNETYQYIFREILMMTAIGALIGCIVGAPLTMHIAQAAETANMMFGRTIEPLSFVASFAITMAFAVLVMITMRHKLAHVNMVESLKSVE